MATQVLVIFIIRTNGRPWADLPRPIFVATSLGALLVALAIPFTPLAQWLGFQTPPLAMTGAITAVAAVYLVCAELLKQTALKKVSRRRHKRRPNRQSGSAKGSAARSIARLSA